MPNWEGGHHISLIAGGEAYFAALAQSMDAAQQEVRLETYIFDFTASGAQVAESLVRSAQRGVPTYLLIDGAGTHEVPLLWQQRFSEAGVRWRTYNPLGRLGLLIPSGWRRLHRKLCVIDGGTPRAVGFCGGINILDDYYDPNHGALSQPRFDFAVQVQGPLVQDMVQATRSLWQRTSMAERMRHPVSTMQQGWQSARQWLEQPRPTSAKPLAREPVDAHMARAALLLRDNVRNRQRIEKAYLKAIGEARQEIIICNAYFLPGKKLRKALLAATGRGVKVRLLLQGRYEYFMQYHAARPVYALLLAAGIEIHEYATSFLHAKVAVIDAYSARAWATVGSSNLDPLSLLLAREANVVVQDQAFAQELREQLDRAMREDGKRVDPLEFSNRPWQQRALDRIAYGLMRFALAITGRRY
jgi:cardiolipin synthase A/B